jgi:hypothetical protein
MKKFYFGQNNIIKMDIKILFYQRNYRLIYHRISVELYRTESERNFFFSNF